MAHKHNLEALLRPPVEFYPAIVHAGCAVVCAEAPWSLALHPNVGYGMAGVFGAFALHRARQGARIVRYHRNLKRLPYYAMSSREIPVSRKYLFVGKGFEWRPIHTQRLRDCFSEDGSKYLEPSWWFKLAREYEKRHENWLTNLTSKDSVFNPVRPLPPVEGIPAIHGVEPNEVDVVQSIASRVGHTLVQGTTRVGKTRLAENFVTQDIHRGKTPEEMEVVVFFDPKGDPDMLIRMYIETKRAGREFYIFHLGYPDVSARYNAVGRFDRISEVASRISGQLSGEGNSAVFKQFAWRFINIVANALTALGQRPNYKLISDHVQNIDSLFLDYTRNYFTRQNPKLWAELCTVAQSMKEKNLPPAMRDRPLVYVINKYIAEHGVSDNVLIGLMTAVRYDRTYFDKIVASLLPLLEKLTTGNIAELLSPDYGDMQDDRPILDWEAVIRKRAVVYVGLDALSDATVAAAVGNSMFADLVSMAGYLYKFGTDKGLPSEGKKTKPIRINLHCDEFNELMGDEFIPLVNKGGGAGVQVTAYTQTLSDIEARIGSRAKAGQVIGNFNTLYFLRVKELATAELLTKNLHNVTIKRSTVLSGTTDSSNPDDDKDFSSSTGQRILEDTVPMLMPADITNLPKGQAFALMDGSRLWKIRIPLPAIDKEDLALMPKSIKELTENMRKNYQPRSNWWAPAFTEYTPSKDIIAAFEALGTEIEGAEYIASDAEIELPDEEEINHDDEENDDDDE